MARNSGAFKPGDDPRRHQLTTEERRRGGKAAFRKLRQHHPAFARWLAHHLRPPIDRAARNQALLDWIAERRRQEPDDMPY